MSELIDILKEELPTLKDSFGDSVTYVHKPSNAQETATAIFSDPALESDFPGVTSVLKVFTEDLSIPPAKNDEIHYGGDEYVVFDLREKRTGITLLGLRKKRG